VVFVCTHNSARSQLAAALWNGTSPIPATSAGTHPAPAVHPGAIAAARRHRVPLAPVPPRHVDDVLRPDDADLVITVCDAAHEELALADVNPARLHWSVPDPARTGEDAAFDRVVTDLTGRIARVAPAVRPTDRRPDTGGPHAG
jgi:protein-tyrosine-phosphatase